MGTTPVAIYRTGNRAGPRLDNVRARDVSIVNRNGVDCVLARSGGVSCFDDPRLLPSGPRWKLPSGSPHPDELYLRGPTGQGHWTWEPATDMPLADFKAILTRLGRDFK